MVSSVNSTLIWPNLDILSFLSNNNDLRTMLTIHCKSLITLTFSYTRIFSIYNNRLSSESTSPYKSLISLLKFKSSLFSMTQAGKFIHHRRNLGFLEKFGKWFNVKLSWEKIGRQFNIKLSVPSGTSSELDSRYQSFENVSGGWTYGRSDMFDLLLFFIALYIHHSI